ncbi:MAG TPA: BatD family protein [Anaeromyxobacter sp.]|nr:BatD family protein [Anaeromyxobacter sp.]
MTGELARAALVAFTLLGAAGASAAEVNFHAGVDRTEIARDEVVELRVRLETPEAPSRLDLPATADFEVLGQARSNESSVSLGGGAGVLLRQAYTVAWRLRPTRSGSLTVPAAIAVVRGRTYLTQPIVVTVAAAGTAPAPSAPPGGGGGRAFHGWERDVLLQVELDRREGYVGEQVVAEFWLYSRQEVVSYAGGGVNLDGFWKEDLETPSTLKPERRTLNGVPTGAYLVQRVALFPTRSGELTVGSMELRNITVRLGGGSLLGGDLARVDRKSAPVTFHVKPLPTGAPPDFEPVNVGTLSLAASAQPEQVAVGEPFTLRMAVSGDGNVRTLSPPHLHLIPGARVFEPTTRDAVVERDRRLAGTRTEETVVVPGRAGELVIPPTEWPYFDPRAGQYRSVRTPELTVRVMPAVAGADPGATPGSNALAVGLRPIRTDLSLSPRGPPAWERRWFLALLLLPPLGFVVATGAAALRARGSRSGKGAARGSRRRITIARRLSARGNAAAALAEVERALLGYASERLGRSAAGLTREALIGQLSRAGAHAPALRALDQALELVEVSRYGGGDVHGEEVLTAAERALSALEEADWQPAEVTA